VICDSPDESAGDVYLVHDAWRNLFDMALVFSQNTDPIEPVRIVRNEIKKPIAVVVLDGKALTDIPTSVRRAPGWATG
jgi:hypothetical protein